MLTKIKKQYSWFEEDIWICSAQTDCGNFYGYGDTEDEAEQDMLSEIKFAEKGGYESV